MFGCILNFVWYNKTFIAFNVRGYPELSPCAMLCISGFALGGKPTFHRETILDIPSLHRRPYLCMIALLTNPVHQNQDGLIDSLLHSGGIKTLVMITHLEHTVTVGIGNMSLQASEMCLVVESEVKILQSQLGIFQIYLPEAFGNHEEWILTCPMIHSMYMLYAIFDKSLTVHQHSKII